MYTNTSIYFSELEAEKRRLLARIQEAEDRADEANSKYVLYNLLNFLILHTHTHRRTRSPIYYSAGNIKLLNNC